MPYASRAQQKYFHYLESEGKMPKKTVKEFDESTDYDQLPEHVKMAEGGMITPEDNFDWDEGHAYEYDSSGEPHTEHELESEHPMEFMHKGGRIKRMAHGGMVSRSNFAKALRKAY